MCGGVVERWSGGVVEWMRGVWSVECKVWSVVWSEECKVEIVECKV